MSAIKQLFIKPYNEAKHERVKNAGGMNGVYLRNIRWRTSFRTFELKAQNTLLEKQVKDLSQLNNNLAEDGKQVDAFWSNLAHDLKSPNITLRNLIYQALEKAGIEEKNLALNKCLKYEQEAESLLDNLIEMGRLRRGFLVPVIKEVDVCLTIELACKVYENKAAIKKISLENHTMGMPNVLADERMLGSILQNLISNSIKFTKDEGRIMILASENEKYMVISIVDNGVGMSEEEIKTALSPHGLQTSDGTRGEAGTGLGMKIVKEYVEKMGGKLKIESAPGKGTKVKFSLPLAAP